MRQVWNSFKVTIKSKNSTIHSFKTKSELQQPWIKSPLLSVLNKYSKFIEDQKYSERRFKCTYIYLYSLYDIYHSLISAKKYKILYLITDNTSTVNMEKIILISEFGVKMLRMCRSQEGYVYIFGLLFQCASTIKIQLVVFVSSTKQTYFFSPWYTITGILRWLYHVVCNTCTSTNLLMRSPELKGHLFLVLS
jgi:hypothetical protein